MKKKKTMVPEKEKTVMPEEEEEKAAVENKI